MKNKIIIAVILTTVISFAMFLGGGIPKIIAMVLDNQKVAYSPSVLEIKGIKIGMTEHDANYAKIDSQMKAIQSASERVAGLGFTIGGVRSKNDMLNDVDFTFRDEKLVMLTFIFKPDGFDRVIEAVKSKYPMLVCNESIVSNAMGASFHQIDCGVNDSQGNTLLITKFDDNIETSSLHLFSQRYLDEQEKKRSDKKKDI
ncbi:MAG: hypothetical protein M0R41_11350 [Methylobacter tundripaludum]|nr:hypothetical protein [Methylobacter tundripaludum]